MARKPPDAPGPSSSPDDPRKANDDTQRDTREGNGRFKPGHCPNPKGRPRKAKASVEDPLARILEAKLADYTAVQANKMTVREALFRSIISTGMKNASVAIALLKLAELDRASTGAPAQSPDDLADEEEAVLSRYLEREMRRRRSDGEPGDEPDDQPGDEAEE